MVQKIHRNFCSNIFQTKNIYILLRPLVIICKELQNYPIEIYLIKIIPLLDNAYKQSKNIFADIRKQVCIWKKWAVPWGLGCRGGAVGCMFSRQSKLSFH